MQFFVKPGTDAEWFERWREWRMEWHQILGLTPAKLQWHQHGPDELAHYAKRRVRHPVRVPLRLAGDRGHPQPRRLRPRPAPGVLRQEARVLRPGGERALPPVHRGDLGRRGPGDPDAPGGCLPGGERSRGRPAWCSGFHPASRRSRRACSRWSRRTACRSWPTALYHDLKRQLPALLRRQRRHRPALPPDGRGRHAVRHHGGRRHRWRSGPSRCATATRCSRSGSGSTRWRATSRSGSAARRWADPCASPTSKRWWSGWPARCPASSSTAWPRSSSRPARVPHPDRPGIFTLGECIPLPAGGDAGPRASRAGSCSITARSRRSRTVTPGFDWRDEALETLTHELRHHLEWRARAPDLEEFDWAVEQNYARQDGEAFDPGVLSCRARRWETTRGGWRTTSSSTGS